MTGSEDRGGWTPGDVVLGTYEVYDVRAGGMGVVYRVRHREWDVDLAVKEPRAEVLRTHRGLSDFVMEAENWVRLGLHPHTVRCVYVREIDGLPRVFAEWVDGTSLSEAIGERALYAGGPGAALRRILDVAIQFAWGLQHAHEHGLIHRDVKPANVMVADDGTVKVTDFGLARTADGLAAGRGLRGAGFSGTRAYCSPEQAGAAAELTFATDVWSWALSVLEMFTGHLATRFGEAGAEVLAAFVGQGVPSHPSIPDLPAALADLLRRCLARDPGGRPAGMTAVADELISLHDRLAGVPYRRERPEAARLLADDLSNQALSFLDLGRPDEAETLWTAALGADPHHVHSVYNRGLRRWRDGRMTDAELLGELEEVRGSHLRTRLVDHLLGLVRRERAGDDDVRVLAADVGPIGPAIAVSADGCWAVSGHQETREPPLPDREGVVRVWDLTEGRCRHTLPAHPRYAGSVAVGGGLAASGGDDRTVLVWHLATGRLVHRFTDHATEIRSVALSRDGVLLASAVADGTVRVWDTRSGECVQTFRGPYFGHTDAVAVRRHLSSIHLVKWEGTTQRIRTWDLATGRLVDSVQLHGADVCLSPEGRYALTVGGERRQVHDLVAGEVVATLRNDAGRTSFSVDDQGRWALSPGPDGVRVWELATGRCLRTLAVGDVSEVTTAGGLGVAGADGRLLVFGLTAAGPRSPWSYARPATSTARSRAAAVVTEARDHADRLLRDGRRSAAAGALRPALDVSGYERNRELLDRWAEIGRGSRPVGILAAWQEWTLETGAVPTRGHHTLAGTRRFTLGPDSTIALSGDGRYALSPAGGTILVWDLATGELRHHLTTHGPAMNCATFGGDGRWVVTGGEDTLVRVWDVATGALRHALPGHAAPIEAVAASGDGSVVASGCLDGTVRLWNPADGRCVRVLTDAAAWITTVAVSANANTVVAGGLGGTGSVWIRGQDQLRRVAAGKLDHVTAGMLSADGRTLLSPTLGGGGIWVSDPVTGELRSRAELVGHSPATIEALVVGADGRLAQSAGTDGVVRVWDLVAGGCVHVLTGHSGSVTALAPSTHGHIAVSGGDDGTIRLWDVDAGRCLRVLQGRCGPIALLGLSTDARTLLAVGSDETMRVWRLAWEYDSTSTARSR